MRVHVPAQVEDSLVSTGGEDASEASARRRLLNEYGKFSRDPAAPAAAPAAPAAKAPLALTVNRC